MRKMYKGLIGMALVLSLMVTFLPMGVWAQSGGFHLQITPSVSNAKVGDVIEYTITATGADIMALEFKLAFPEGLGYVENSAQIPQGLAEDLGWAQADWTEETQKWTGFNDTGRDIPEGTVILTFRAVAQEEGTHRVEMKNVYPYNGSFCEVEAVVTLDDVTVTANTQPTAPVFTATAKESSVVLSWDATGITKTWIYMGTSANDLKPTYSTTNGSYTVSNLDHNQTYYFQLAHNINGQMKMSENVQAVKPLAPPYPAKISGLKAGNIQETSFTLTWDEVPGIDKYFIFLNGVTYTSTTEATATVVNRKVNRSYDVQVLASVGGKMVQTLKDADVLSVKTAQKQPQIPVFSGSVLSGKVVLSWDTTDVTKTWIYMGTSADDLKPTYSTTSGSFTVSGLEANTTYYFKLYHNIGGKVVTSEQILEITP